MDKAAARAGLERLRMTRVAKDLFLSDWYARSCETLAFSRESCETLARIGEESRAEREALFEVFDRWMRRLEPTREADEKARDVARVARRDFLLGLIQAKDDSADAIERAALLAPPELRVELEELAAVDVRHANDLRELLVSEVQEAWTTRRERRV